MTCEEPALTLSVNENVPLLHRDLGARQNDTIECGPAVMERSLAETKTNDDKLIRYYRFDRCRGSASSDKNSLGQLACHKLLLPLTISAPAINDIANSLIQTSRK